MENLIEIKSEEQFQQLIQEGIVAVDFWAEWCGPCRTLGPIFKELAERNPEHKFLKVSVDENPEIAQKYSVRSIPQISFLKDGEEKAKKIGVTPVDMLQDALEIAKND